MNNNKALLAIAALLLAAAVAWVIFSRMDAEGDQAGGEGGPQLGRRPERPVVGKHHAGKPGPENSREEAGEGTLRAGARKPTVKISGLGTLSYTEVRKSMNLNEILHRCGLITQGDYEGRLRRGSKATADVYLNEKGEIVHISYQKGLYKTRSRDVEAMASFRDDPRGGPTLEIDDFGIPGLTLDNTEMLKGILRTASIDSTVSSSAEYYEFEVTPVMVEVTGGWEENPQYAKYIGRMFPMILIKKTTGMPGSDEYRVDYINYKREDIVRRDWRLTSFLPDPQSEDGIGPEIAGGKVWDEPLLEAWERKQAELADQKRDGGRD